MTDTHQRTDRVAVVTGGSRGVGLAIASSLVSRGVHVMVGAPHEDTLQRAVEQLTSVAHPTARVGTQVTDVRDPGQASRLIDRAVDWFGGLDILVNNAGIAGFAPVTEQGVDEWARVLGTNLSGPFYCCRAAIPHLRRRGGGWIINISSLASTSPFAGGAAYCASKAGLNAFSEALMQEVRHDDIRVSLVLPGSIRTDFSSGAGQGTDWKLAPEDVAAVVLDLLAHDRRSLPSRVEIRPSKPRKS